MILVSINKCLFVVVVSLTFIANIYSNVIPDYNQLAHQDEKRSVECNNREVVQGENGKQCLFFSNDQRCELKCSKRCSINGNSFCCEVLPTCSCFIKASSEVASFSESMSCLDTLNPSIRGCRTCCVEHNVENAICAKTRIECTNQNYYKGLKGEKGGSDYLQGERGPRGTSGNSGASGIRGDPGPSGVDGYPGASGVDGYPGPSGVDGYPGPSGVDGYPDASGIKGDEPGYTCSNGASGPSAPKGVPGPLGKPDLDVCHVKCVLFCTIPGYSFSYCCKAEPSC